MEITNILLGDQRDLTHLWEMLCFLLFPHNFFLCLGMGSMFQNKLKVFEKGWKGALVCPRVPITGSLGCPGNVHFFWNVMLIYFLTLQLKEEGVGICKSLLNFDLAILKFLHLG